MEPYLLAALALSEALALLPTKHNGIVHALLVGFRSCVREYKGDEEREETCSITSSSKTTVSPPTVVRRTSGTSQEKDEK